VACFPVCLTVCRFRRGALWYLVATDLLGRGMDFKGVSLVVNVDLPPTPTAYIHRIGRTGRAGRRGRAVTLFTEADVPNLRSIANVMRESGCEVPEWMLQLKPASRATKRKGEHVRVKRRALYRRAGGGGGGGGGGGSGGGGGGR